MFVDFRLLLMLKYWTVVFSCVLCAVLRRWPGCSSPDRWVQQAHVPECYQKREQQRGGGSSGGRRSLVGWGLCVSAKIQEQPVTPLPERLTAPRDGGQRCDRRPQEEPLRLLQLQRIRRGSPLTVLLGNRGQLRLPYRSDVFAVCLRVAVWCDCRSSVVWVLPLWLVYR